MFLRKTWVGLLLLTVVATTLRLWQIDSIPPGFHFDESFEGLEAWRILTDPTYRPIFIEGNFGLVPLNVYANAVTFGVFTFFGGEPGPTAMRVTAALFGVLGVVTTWLAASELRQLGAPRLTAAFPWLAAALLATLRWHIHFSRMGIEPILVPLVTATALWLLLRARRTHSTLVYVGFGAVTALGMYTYQGAWILPFLLAGAWAILWWLDWRQGNPRPLLTGGLIAAAVAVIGVLPLVLFALAQPDLFLLRPEQIAVGGQTATQQTLGESVLAYVLMFVPLVQAGDLDPRRNVPGLAALNLWQAIPFWLGVLLACWRIRQPAYSILLLLLAGLLLPGVLSEYAPHYHRVLGAAAPVALLGGVGLDWIWAWWGEGRRARGEDSTQSRRDAEARKENQISVNPRHPRSIQGARGGDRAWNVRWVGWVSVALLVIGAVVAARDYFGRWAALPDLFYAFDVGLWEIGQEIAAQPADAPIYLTPRSADHPTLAFAWETRPGSHGAPVTFDGRHVFPLTAGRNAQPEQYLVIEDEDFRTRLLLPELFPDAAVERSRYDWQGRVYANTYVRPIASAPARSPMAAASFEVGDGITLAGYDAQTATLEAGRMLYVQLYWDVAAAPTQDWTVFVHLLKADDELVAGVDSRPGAGSLPTTRWQADWRILDEYQMLLPSDLPAGEYALAIGLYSADGARLPADGAGLQIGEVTLE
ncbi:MAG TPA: hypothetical protein DCL15_06705 [Chloroflexi bacterium]|nr:hypothetical protein [Chloroflexota bacterium]HHW87822.1 hypothetical protein [Chloroflexota bacterium]